MNYKSGDLVKITGNCNHHQFSIGEIVRLQCKDCDVLNCWRAESLNKIRVWYVMESNMKPATMPQKIIVTTDGKTTLARLFDGKTMVKRAEAKCAPSDVFDFGIGAELAVKRLMGEKPVTEPVESEPVKLYCVRSIFRQFKFVKGKIYNSTHDFRITDENGAVTPCRYSSIKERDICNPDYANALVPLVRRPAKVGEWVYIGKDYSGHHCKPGHIYRANFKAENDGVYFEQDGTGYVKQSEYLVLDGYHSDSE